MVIKSGKTASRSAVSSTQGTSHELDADTKILLAATTVAQINDNIAIEGHQFLIVSLFPRHGLGGKLDHYEAGCTYWVGA